MRPKPIMVLGCTSDAGKSFLATALCRHLANRGVRVAPFKAQNMSNNAAVTADGGEIGRAQHLQALAARVTPDVRMNPVLLKPSADTFSQVVVLGRYDERATRMPWLERRAYLWPIVRDALHGLAAEHEQLVLEGAGSPAEVNLRASDVVNMAVALECEADVYLVSDIDRGGSFAHLLGTWMCLTSAERARVRGFVLNRFRGDAALLGDAPAWLERQTGVPVVATVPYLRHALPEEDSFRHRGRYLPGTLNLALVLYPYASNLDEFDALFHEDGVNVVPVQRATPLETFDAILLPGSKNTVASLRHLREGGIAAEVVRAARAGTRVFGVCGGMQMLGRTIADPHGLEGGDAEGLGLLDIATELRPHKVTRRIEVPWRGGSVAGYEIHHGTSRPGRGAREWLEGELGFASESHDVSGAYVHDLFADTRFRQAFLEELGWRGLARDWAVTLDAEIERVARLVTEAGWEV
jgi:adenosylcobyric acid synthase